MKITNVNIYGLEESISASGYPMQAWVSDKMHRKPNIKGEGDKLDSNFVRATRLGSAPAGSGHDNFLKGIIVQFDIDFTKQVWSEAQRYHWFDIVSSCSTMHKLKEFALDKAYIKYVDPLIVEQMKTLQKIYNEHPTEENFLRLIYSNPVGMKLTARITTNYLQLKTMYFQRANHRLPEWRFFCGWIEQLPQSKELGVCE